jgi:ApaG protein
MTKLSAPVTVHVDFLEEQSNPDEGQYLFAYTVQIKNENELPIQIIARQWIITDSDGNSQQIKGLGVVGQQPVLNPGQSFEYTSWATISTPFGSMRGIYFCISEQAEWFEAPITEFALSAPRILH